MISTEDWFWAAWNGELGEAAAAGDRFVIASGKDELWRRVRREVSPTEHCAWNAVHPGSDKAELEHILDLALHIAPMYGVNYNRFVFEAAKIRVFAKWLRHRPYDLCNSVSNPIAHGVYMALEPYSDANMRKLGNIVNATLGIDDDWF